MDKNKKATIDPVNEIFSIDNKYFQYSVTVALNHDEYKKDLKRITRIKPFLKLNLESNKLPIRKI